MPEIEADLDVAVSIDAIGLDTLKAELVKASFIVIARSKEDAVTRSVSVELLGHRLQVVTAEDLVLQAPGGPPSRQR